MTEKMIGVFGGAHIDRRGRIYAQTVAGASNPGAWFEEAGGGGFNAARTMARLGETVYMVSPRGGDSLGDAVAEAAEAAGVIDCPFTFLDRTTPSYTAILEKDGNLVIALADMELYRLFGPRRLRQRALRDRISGSAIILMDANLPEETLSALTATTEAQGIPTAGIAISPAKVVRFTPSLSRLSTLFMNRAEAITIMGEQPENPLDWPKALNAAGLKGGVITRGPEAAIAFRGSEIATVVPPPLDALGDVTGAGDALAAGFLTAQLAGKSLGDSLRAGVAAASITVASPLAVSENISPEALEQALALVPAAEILS